MKIFVTGLSGFIGFLVTIQVCRIQESEFRMETATTKVAATNFQAVQLETESMLADFADFAD